MSAWAIEFDGPLYWNGTGTSLDKSTAVLLADRQSAERIIERYPLPGGRAVELPSVQ